MSFENLCLTAFLTAVVHAVAGPDHYLPFIALGRDRSWSMKRTTVITLISGVAHVLSSLVLGVIALLVGMQLGLVKYIESMRGDVVAWLLMVFGLVYAVWGVRAAYVHTHSHGNVAGPKKNSLAAWIIFIIFALGPCEVLIPLLMFPAASYGVGASLVVGGIFMVGTLITMLLIVLGTLYGLNFVPVQLHRFGHMFTGVIIFSCGFAVQLGL